MIAYYFMLYPLEWQYRRAMEISDENIIDLYIILGVFCGTLLISSLVCIAIYCHWHKNHKYSKYPLVHVFSPPKFVSDPCFGWDKLRTFVVPNRPESPGVCIYTASKDSIGQFSRMYSAMRNKSGYNKIDSSINVKSKRMKLPSDNPPRILTLDGSPLIFLRCKIQSPRSFWISDRQNFPSNFLSLFLLVKLILLILIRVLWFWNIL